MGSATQREFIADAAARGITMVELLREFQGNQELSSAVYKEMYPRPPSLGGTVPTSECPVMSAVFLGMSQLVNYGGYTLDDTMGPERLSDERAAAPSSMEQQTERALACARWFRVSILTLIETDSVLVPAADVARACKPLFEALIEEHSPPSIVAAVFESSLAVMNAYGSECARGNKGRGASVILGSLSSGSGLMDLWRKLFPWVPPGPNVAHVHPDGDLDGALTLAEAAAGISETPALDADLMAQLDAAGQAMGFVPSEEPVALTPMGDVAPGGVLKK